MEALHLTSPSLDRFTPGPWSLSATGLNVNGGPPDPNAGWPNGKRVANTDRLVGPAERAANARLISGAPDAHDIVASLAEWWAESNGTGPRQGTMFDDDRTFGEVVAAYLEKVRGA